ncbi:MAG: hypothetical protein GY762_02390 [Proteobacteria bacterium]|nr:hypothetical protein [Pseudomonadota bacterium]
MTDFVNNLPLSGGVVVAGLIYVGASLMTGQIVGERLIKKSGWDNQCRAGIRADIVSRQPAQSFVPKIDCNSILGGWMGREGKAWCAQYGEKIINPLGDQLNARERQLREASKRRLTNALSKSSSRCSCAASLALESNRVSFALYTGSIRLVNPPAIKNLKGTLATALNNPLCSVKE